MRYGYKTLDYSELKQLQYDLTPENVCHRIFRYFDFPQSKRVNEEDSFYLADSIENAESVFLAQVEVSVKNRIQDVSQLLKGELLQFLSSANKVYLVFVSPSKKHLTNDELKAIQNIEDYNFNDYKFWCCLNYEYYKFKGVTRLYIIAVKSKDDAYDEDEMMNNVLDKINNIPLGEYRDILVKQANDYCKSAENHSVEILPDMADFLQGAAAAIELYEKKSIPSNEEEIDDDDVVYFEDVYMGDLGQYRQTLMNEALSYAKEIIYPNNDITAVSSTIDFFLRGAEAAIKLIKEDFEKE